MHLNRFYEEDGQSFDFESLDSERPLPPDHVGDEEPWYAVLGVEANAAPDEIRSAYWAALRAYHPDHVATLGRKIQEVAAAETKRIIRAFEQAKRASGRAKIGTR